LLDASHRRKALQFLEEAAEIASVEVNSFLNCPRFLGRFFLQAPSIEEVANFIGKRPPCEAEILCPPAQYWSVIYPDSPISPLARMMTAFPSSQTDVERVFSTASFQASDREN